MKTLFSWLDRLFRTSISAASSIAFYRSARDRKIGEAVSHLAALASLVWILPFAVMFFLDVRAGLTRLMDGFRATVPPGAVFEMKDHYLTSSLTEPIIVRVDGAALIFNAASSTHELAPDEVGLSIGAEALVQKTAPNRTETMAYAEVPDFRLTKEEAEAWITRYAKWGVFAVSLIALVGVALSIAVGTAVSSLFHALLLWLVLRLMKRHWHYRNALAVTLFASTVPILAGAIFALARISAGVIPSALYWVLLAFVAYDAYREGSPVTAVKGAEHAQSKEASGDDRSGSDQRSA